VRLSVRAMMRKSALVRPSLATLTRADAIKTERCWSRRGRTFSPDLPACQATSTGEVYREPDSEIGLPSTISVRDLDRQRPHRPHGGEHGRP
jgi:hypothetical protein